MNKLTSQSKKIKSLGQYQKKFNPNNLSFVFGMGLSVIGNIITNATNIAAQDAYNDNPNPLYRSDAYSWGGSTMRFTPQLTRSSYNLIGGW